MQEAVKCPIIIFTVLYNSVSTVFYFLQKNHCKHHGIAVMCSEVSFLPAPVHKEQCAVPGNRVLHLPVLLAGPDWR